MSQDTVKTIQIQGVYEDNISDGVQKSTLMIDSLTDAVNSSAKETKELSKHFNDLGKGVEQVSGSSNGFSKTMRNIGSVLGGVTKIVTGTIGIFGKLAKFFLGGVLGGAYTFIKTVTALSFVIKGLTKIYGVLAKQNKNLANVYYKMNEVFLKNIYITQQKYAAIQNEIDLNLKNSFILGRVAKQYDLLYNRKKESGTLDDKESSRLKTKYNEYIKQINILTKNTLSKKRSIEINNMFLKKDELLYTSLGKTSKAFDKITKRIKEYGKSTLKAAEGNVMFGTYVKAAHSMAKGSKSIYKATGGIQTLGKAYDSVISKGVSYIGNISSLIFKHKVFALAIGAVIAGIGLLGAAFNKLKPAIDEADNIDKMSQKIGFTSDQFQKWSYVLGLSGTSMNAVNMSVVKLQESIGRANKPTSEQAKLFNNLGVTLKKSDGTFRKTGDIFEDSILKLSDMTDETERAIVARKLFGTQAKELGPLLNANSNEIQHQLEISEKYNAYNEKFIKVSTTMNDTLALMSKKFKQVRNKALLPFIELFSDMIQSLKRTNIAKVLTGPIYIFGAVMLGLGKIVSGVINGILLGFTAVETAAEGINLVFAKTIQLLSHIPGMPKGLKEFANAYNKESLDAAADAAGRLGEQLQITLGVGGKYRINKSLRGEQKVTDVLDNETTDDTTKINSDKTNILNKIESARKANLQKTLKGRLQLLKEAYNKDIELANKYGLSTLEITRKYANDRNALYKEILSKHNAEIDRALSIIESARTSNLERTYDGRNKLLEEKYNKDIELAEKAGLDTTEITKKYISDIERLNNEEDAKRKSIINKRLEFEKKVFNTKFKLEEMSINRMKDGLDKRLELLNISQSKEIDGIRALYDEKLITEDQYQQQLLEIESSYAEKRQEAKLAAEEQDKQARLQKYDAVVGNIETLNNQTMELMSSVFKLQSDKQSQAVDRWEASEKAKIDSLNISSKRKAQLETRLAKESEAKRKAQAEKEKKWAIAQTLINGALSIVKLWSNPGFPFAIPMSILVAGVTAASIATISSQSFATGGIVGNTTGSIAGDNELIRANPGEMVLTRNDQNILLKKLNSNESSGNVITSNVTIQGDATPDTIDKLEEQNQSFLKKLEDGLEELASYSRLPSFA